VSIKEWLLQSHNNPSPEICSEIIVIYSIVIVIIIIEKFKKKCSMGETRKIPTFNYRLLKREGGK